MNKNQVLNFLLGSFISLRVLDESNLKIKKVSNSTSIFFLGSNSSDSSESYKASLYMITKLMTNLQSFFRASSKFQSHLHQQKKTICSIVKPRNPYKISVISLVMIFFTISNHNQLMMKSCK